jgi:purine-binding chemotaxis protein CheW
MASDHRLRATPSGEPSPEDIRRILRERARALAKPSVQGPVATETLDLLVFALAGERYGIEVAYVREVIRIRGLTPVPCMPPVVAGVVNCRGRIIVVLDVLRLLNQPNEPATERSWLVVVEVEEKTFGILASAGVQVIPWRTHELAPPPASPREDQPPFIRGVTEETVLVLEPEALARTVETMIANTVA